MFENINWMVSNIFAASNDDFVIRENESPEDIETGSGVAATDEKTRTCALCAALNNTVFRNDNKPEYYHPHCKCKITKYTLNKVVFDFPIRKITEYLFLDENKKAMMHSMGYIPDDYREIYELIKRETEKKLFILRLHPEQAGHSRTAFYGKNSSERETGASGRIL